MGRRANGRCRYPRPTSSTAMARSSMRTGMPIIAIAPNPAMFCKPSRKGPSRHERDVSRNRRAHFEINSGNGDRPSSLSAHRAREETMPRLRYIEESEKTPLTRALIESAKRTGAPDPRVVSLMTRSKLGIAWVEYWNKLLYQGTLPHKLKEMCRIKISVAHQCGYCSTVRSNVAKQEGRTEHMIEDLFDYAGSKHFTPREKAALRYAELFKQGEHAMDKDEVYTDLAKVDGVGKFVKSLNVLSWEEACALHPKLKTNVTRIAAE